MSKSKKEKYLKKAIKMEKAKNQMIHDTRKTTAYGLILLSPFITMFGVMAYAMTQ